MVWSCLGPRFCCKAGCTCWLPVTRHDQKNPFRDEHFPCLIMFCVGRIGSLSQCLEFANILTRSTWIGSGGQEWPEHGNISKASDLLIQHHRSAVNITHRSPYLASSSSLELRFLARLTLLCHTKTVNKSFCIISAIKPVRSTCIIVHNQSEAPHQLPSGILQHSSWYFSQSADILIDYFARQVSVFFESCFLAPLGSGKQHTQTADEVKMINACHCSTRFPLAPMSNLINALSQERCVQNYYKLDSDTRLAASTGFIRLSPKEERHTECNNIKLKHVETCRNLKLATRRFSWNRDTPNRRQSSCWGTPIMEPPYHPNISSKKKQWLLSWS